MSGALAANANDQPNQPSPRPKAALTVIDSTATATVSSNHGSSFDRSSIEGNDEPSSNATPQHETNGLLLDRKSTTPSASGIEQLADDAKTNPSVASPQEFPEALRPFSPTARQMGDVLKPAEAFSSRTLTPMPLESQSSGRQQGGKENVQVGPPARPSSPTSLREAGATTSPNDQSSDDQALTVGTFTSMDDSTSARVDSLRLIDSMPASANDAKAPQVSSPDSNRIGKPYDANEVPAQTADTPISTSASREESAVRTTSVDVSLDAVKAPNGLTLTAVEPVPSSIVAERAPTASAPKQPTHTVGNSSRASIPVRSLADALVATVDDDGPEQPSVDTLNSVTSQPAGSGNEETQPTFTPLETPSVFSMPKATDSQGRFPVLNSTDVGPITASPTVVQANTQGTNPAPISFNAALRQSAPNPKSIPVVTAEGGSHTFDASPAAPVAESQPLRSTQELAPLIETGRTANLTVQLADGQTAHATVRERAGSVEVKIVTSTSSAADRVTGEINSMRQNLDAAGLRLEHSEVSYQQGSGKGRDGQENQSQRQPQANQSANDIFTLSEVAE